jgi:lipopolysaccharide transport system ATP-binding protein
MSQYAITVDNLSKAFRIGLKEEKEDTFFSAIVSTLKSPLRNYKRLRDLGRISENEVKEDVFWALRDISFNVEHGDTLAIIGKNGAGKSTLLKILSQITEPTKGKITINGKVASLLEVGTGFNAELTGRENVYLNGTILGMRKKEIDSVFDAIVDFSGVEKFIDTPIKRYSSGMKVRLAFAVAAHLQPEILIVDEVLAVGDAEFQKKCLGKMDEVAKDGRTVLFVSHQMAAVQSLCKRAIMLKEGEIAKTGTSKEVVDFYLNNYSKNILERSWNSPEEAPGNELVRIKSVKLIPDGDRVTVNTPFRLVFEIWNLQDKARLNLSMPFLALSGEEIFAIGSDGAIYDRGIVEGSCHIPANFLNDGMYAINLLVVQDTSRVVFNFKDALTFEVEDVRESLWFGKWPGFVRPTFIPFHLEQKIN